MWLFVLIHIRNYGEVGIVKHAKAPPPPPNNFLTDRSMTLLLLWILFLLFVFRVCLSYCLVWALQPCSHLLGKGWRLDSLVCDAFLCFFTFPYATLGQVWYLIVSIPDLCLLAYLGTFHQLSTHLPHTVGQKTKKDGHQVCQTDCQL